MEREGNPLLPKDIRHKRTDDARKVAQLPPLVDAKKCDFPMDEYLTQWMKDVDDLLK